MSKARTYPRYVIFKSDAFGDWEIVQINKNGRNQAMVTAPTYEGIMKKYHEGEKKFASLPSV